MNKPNLETPAAAGIGVGILATMIGVALIDQAFAGAAARTDFATASLWASVRFWLRDWGAILLLLAMLALIVKETKS